jgi:3-oxoacyl-[acyl-carrier-protein] synthase II
MPRTTSADPHHRHEDVVITGMGAVTSYGVGVQALADGLFSAVPTARRISLFDASQHLTQIACEVPEFTPEAFLPPKLISQLDRFAQFGLVAAEEALRQAGLLAVVAGEDGAPARWPLTEAVDSARVATLISSSAGGIGQLTEQQSRLIAGGPRRVRPFLTVAMPADMASGQTAIRHGLRGPSFAVLSACATGTDAIGVGLDLIRAGRADVVVAGGAEAAVIPVCVAAFGNAGALSRRNDEPSRASRPFDVDRDGFVMGEGAGVVVLERAAHAAARGAAVLAELAGYGISDDAHHATAPHPEGEGASRALAGALADAGAEPADVGHVNAHGTGTPPNDRIEAKAIRAVLGGHADRVAVTSTKSAVGHMLGAAGAVEAIATITALRQQRVPPSLNLDQQDPDCDLDVVAGQPRDTAISLACSNSFGFGGHNAVLVLRAAA